MTTLNFGYGNNPYFWSDSDPTYSSAGYEQIIYPNFTNENKIEWVNTKSRDRFFLYDVVNKIYDKQGNLVGGDLIWAKYEISIIQLKK